MIPKNMWMRIFKKMNNGKYAAASQNWTHNPWLPNNVYTKGYECKSADIVFFRIEQ